MAASHRPDDEEITRRQVAWADEWRAAAACTDPADRGRAEAAIAGLYETSGRRAPDIRWVPSPRAGVLVWAFAAAWHERVINPWARGDVGNGENRAFNGLADPFGMEPAWTIRLAGRARELVRAATRRRGSHSIVSVEDALGVGGSARRLLATRSVLRTATPVIDAGAKPDAAAVDAASRVLGDAWPTLVLSLGENLARGVFAKALARLATQVLTAPEPRREALQAMQPGQWDGTTPLLASVRDVFGRPLWRPLEGRAQREAAIDNRLELARSAGPWWALDDVAIVSERPLVNRTDDQGRPHAGDGPALAWGDGFEIYAWHGVIVDRSVVMEPERITAAAIDEERNVERRRVLIERFGPERLVREGGAVLIHEDETGRLWRREVDAGEPPWRRRDEPIVLVEVINSTPEPDGTRRTYFLRVPPITLTARQGVAWTFGLGDVDYRPSVES